MEEARRSRFGTIAALLMLGVSIPLSGCGGGPKTGDTIPDAPGQEAGEQASMEEMQRLMQQGMTR